MSEALCHFRKHRNYWFYFA